MKKSSRKPATKLDQIRARLRESAPLLPIAEHLGFHITAVKPGRVTIELDVRPHHANAIGTLHGGVLCDIADAAMALSHATNIAADETFTTLELKINFLKPVWKGKLRAEGKVIHPGRQVATSEGRLYGPDGKLYAHGTTTCVIFQIPVHQ